jgi:hypothetical protein
LPFKQQGTVFPGADRVAALVNRFAQHCHIIDIDADSWRKNLSNRRSRPVTGTTSVVKSPWFRLAVNGP